MSTISSPRRSGSIRGVEGGVKRLLAAIKKKQDEYSNQRTCVGNSRNRRIHVHQRVRNMHAADHGHSTHLTQSLKVTSSSMATIVSPRRSGSVRGVEGSVGKILASIEKRSDSFDHSPMMRRIKNVSTKPKSSPRVLCRIMLQAFISTGGDGGQGNGEERQSRAVRDQRSDGEEHQGAVQASGAHSEGVQGEVRSEGCLPAPCLQQGTQRETRGEGKRLLAPGNLILIFGVSCSCVAQGGQ